MTLLTGCTATVGLRDGREIEGTLLEASTRDYDAIYLETGPSDAERVIPRDQVAKLTPQDDASVIIEKTDGTFLLARDLVEREDAVEAGRLNTVERLERSDLREVDHPGLGVGAAVGGALALVGGALLVMGLDSLDPCTSNTCSNDGSLIGAGIVTALLSPIVGVAVGSVAHFRSSGRMVQPSYGASLAWRW